MELFLFEQEQHRDLAGFLLNVGARQRPKPLEQTSRQKDRITRSAVSLAQVVAAGLDDIAVSSGAACTSANPEPSHVLRAIGVSDEMARASLRFGLGRWTTAEEVDYAVEKISSLVTRLREVSPIGRG